MSKVYSQDDLIAFNRISCRKAVNSPSKLHTLKSACVGSKMERILDLSSVPENVESLIIHAPFATDIISINHLKNLKALHVESVAADCKIRIPNCLRNLTTLELDCMINPIFDREPNLQLRNVKARTPIDPEDDNFETLLSRVINIDVVLDSMDNNTVHIDLPVAERVTIQSYIDAPLVLHVPEARHIKLDVGMEDVVGSYIMYEPEIIKSLDISCSNMMGELRPSTSLRSLSIYCSSEGNKIDPRQFPNLKELELIRTNIASGELNKLTSLLLNEFECGDMDITLDRVQSLNLENGYVRDIRISGQDTERVRLQGVLVETLDLSHSHRLNFLRTMGRIRTLILPEALPEITRVHINNQTDEDLKIEGGLSYGPNMELFDLYSDGQVDYDLPKNLKLRDLMVIAPNYQRIVNGGSWKTAFIGHGNDVSAHR